MENKILVVGSLNIDLTCNVEKIPNKGETVLSNSFSINCGGKGANQAYTCGKLNSNTIMLGSIGNDSYGELLLNSLKSVNVDTTNILKTNKSTGMAFINVDKFGNNSIVVSSNSNNECTIEYIRKNLSAFNECKYVLLQLEIPIKTINEIIKIAKEKNMVVILNPAPIPNNIDELQIDGIDYIIPNEHELEQFVKGNISLEEKINILNKKVKNVIVTLGEKGSIYKNNEKFIKVDSFKVDAKDSVAAGDCFCGAFVSALSKNKSIEESLRFASGASAISVTRKGAQESIPTLNEVEEFLKERN